MPVRSLPRRRRPAFAPLLALAATVGPFSGLPAAAQTSATAAATSGVVFPRYPALSPDGKTLVFSYQGDLWSAPADGGRTATRLTVHPSYESRAAFSPDGRRIAFNSNRYGRSEIFVMSSDGGQPHRLTEYSGGSLLQGWADNGTRILLSSSRELSRRGPALYTVGAGAKPGRAKPVLAITDVLGGSLSPDGKRLVFARGSGDWPRRGYHGQANADIWVYTLATKQFKRVTNFDGEDLWPSWLPDGKTVVYVSERDGTYNLFKQNVDGGSATQITHYKGDGVRLPTVSADGSRAAFEVGDRIATVSLTAPNAVPKVASLAVQADDKINPTDVQTLTGGASEMAVSPDGEQIAFVVKGDVFVIGKEGGKAVRITDSPSRDDDLAWAPDGKTLVFVSNRDGNPELYSATSTDADEPRLSRSLKRTTHRITNTPDREHNPLFSLDGKRLAYVRGNGSLVITDADGKNPKVIAVSLEMGGYSWSPDGKWIAYAGSDEEFNGEILVVPSDGSKPPVNVSKHPRNDDSPAWSPDGTKLFWASERLDRQYDLYYVYLKKEDDERTPEEWVRLREPKRQRAPQPTPPVAPVAPAGTAPAPPPAAPPGTTPPGAPAATPASPAEDDEQQRGGGRRRGAGAPPVGGEPPAGGASPTGVPAPPPSGAGPTSPPPAVVIDFDRIDERVRRLTTLLGDEFNPVPAAGPDGHVFIAFNSSSTGAPELSLLDFVDGRPAPPAPRRIAGGTAASVQWTRDGRTLLYLADGGGIAALAPAGGDPRPIPFRARYSYDRTALQIATFDEAWATLNEAYYDGHFHGADWAALRAKYRPLAAAASDPADFYDVIRLLMGHLNSSHIGISDAPAPYESTSIPTGTIGVIWDETYTGPGLKIARVIRDSPADRTETRLRPGEIVTAINGTVLTADTDPDDLFADTVSERPPLTSERTPIQVTGFDGKSREVLIEPTNYARLRNLLYDEWVEQRRELTHKLSDGRLAYLHIRAMDKGSQDKFEQGLYAEAHGKNGLLIDVRDNGGGSTADYLLTMLTIPRHAFTIGRDGAPGYPQDRLPLYPWQKPAALLINQNSYSNAEIFAHAFTTIERGPVIGVPTFGAVISTGARSLLDGSSIRTPNRGWYNVKTGINEEHTAAQPDKLVVLSPEDDMLGRDPQLEEAVKVLLARAANPVTLPAAQPAK